MPPIPEGCKEGLLKGLYKLSPAKDGMANTVRLIGSGSIMQQVLGASACTLLELRPFALAAASDSRPEEALLVSLPIALAVLCGVAGVKDVVGLAWGRQFGSWFSFGSAAKSRHRPGSRRSAVRSAPDEDEANFGSQEYWDARYAEEGSETYDWLAGYSELRPFVERAVDSAGFGSAVLDLGCGSSRFVEDMYDAGYTNILGLDISPVVIAMMKQRNVSSRPGLRFAVGDALELWGVSNSSLDLVIDKSCLEAMSCDEEASNSNVVRVSAAVSRVLRVGGKYLVFSLSDVPGRALSLPHVAFDIVEEEFAVPELDFPMHIYIATKTAAAEDAAKANMDQVLQMALDMDEASLEA
ncbi:unnamed protein product [Polarella glacialis]|uniref:Methyltransferase type 11 domain-containing protein n=1 Tax=Polarella glacialis TaxID=89957 RepID=A0A813F9E5_POLGL|nr:unnamed protein product [Polarella glacialis]